MLKVRSPQDFGSGLLFIAIGAAGLYFGSTLEFGSASRMGPGFFPMIIAGLIAAMGLLVTVRALAIQGPEIERLQLRPILMLMSALAVFGALTDVTGIVISTILMIAIAACARSGVKPLETLLLAVGSAAFIVLVFVYGLGQPLPLWWGN